MPPSDEEMVRHFATHEAAFDRVREVIADCTANSFHYPPLAPEYDSALDSLGKPIEEQAEVNRSVFGQPEWVKFELDSLWSETGCCFMHVDRMERDAADSSVLRLTMVYYSHGIVDAGTSKCFVYDPELRNRPNIRITEHGDLNEIYRRTYSDTTLYKPVKGNWYIELDHSR